MDILKKSAIQMNKLIPVRMYVTSPRLSASKFGERKLFTPGPLGISKSTKEAMVYDVGSRETEFVALIKNIREKLVKLAGASTNEFTCVPIQGSGTFALEAVLCTTVPRTNGKVLLLENGAYGKRQKSMCDYMGIECHHESFGERKKVDVNRVRDILKNDNTFTHVSIVHCETSVGIFNPITEVGRIVRELAPNCAYFVDAMSTFGAVPLSMPESNIDYMVSSSNKCIEGTPGFSYAVVNTKKLLACKGQSRSLCFDLVDQYNGLEQNGQFRFTPATHAFLAFDKALRELEAEGGVEGRGARYKNNRRILMEGMKKLGFKEFLDVEDAGYIITTYLYPNDPKFDFKEIYKRLYEKGQVIYPGKLTTTDCFRLGNIGDLHATDMEHLLDCIEEVLQDMGITLPVHY